MDLQAGAVKRQENSMRILIVEDDRTIAEGLRYSLEGDGFEAVLCPDKRSALEQMDREGFALYLLDLSLPDGSGYELCDYIKARWEAPVLFLTARDDEVSVVRGLDMGADDYITKPFRIRELVSRMKRALRQYGKAQAAEESSRIGDVTVYPKQARVMRGQEEIFLTALEYRLLLVLLSNRGQVLTRNQLLEGIWDVDGSFINDNTLSVYMKRLREKLEPDGGNHRYIETVRGLGYRLREEGENGK